MKITQNNNGQQQLRVGYGLFTVAAFNPTRSELNKLVGKDDSEDDKEIEYTKEAIYSYGGDENKVEKDVTQANVTIWLKEIKSGKLYPITFSLKNHVQYNSAGDKTCFVNQFGKSFYSDVKENLPEWFTFTKTKKGSFDKEVRPAYVGERELMDFLRNWLNLNEFDKENNLLELPISKVFKGDFSFFNKELFFFLDKQQIVMPLTVGTKEKDGENVEVQRVAKHSLNAKYYTQLNALVQKFKEDNSNTLARHFEGLDNKNYDIKQFVGNMFNEYQKDYFVLEPLRDYNPEENVLNQEQAIVEDSADY